jgi:hypothetical protein
MSAKGTRRRDGFRRTVLARRPAQLSFRLKPEADVVPLQLASRRRGASDKRLLLIGWFQAFGEG